MEKDLSLILLVVAGIILLFLFVYSFRTRVDNYKDELPALDKENDFLEDEMDIITKPSEDSFKIKPIIPENNSTRKFEDDFADAIISVKPITKEFKPPQREFKHQEFKPAQKEFKSQEFKPQEFKSAPALKPAVVHEPSMAPLRPAIVEPAVHEKPENFKPSKILMLHVLPMENEKFIGFDLLQALLVANLRFGEMSIFHRHTLPMGKGKILFSVAQACEPGTFNMNSIGSCQCPGLVLFMQLTGPEHNLDLLEQFIQTAQQLADNLGGVVVSQKRTNPFSSEIKKHFVASVQHHLANLSVSA